MVIGCSRPRQISCCAFAFALSLKSIDTLVTAVPINTIVANTSEPQVEPLELQLIRRSLFQSFFGRPHTASFLLLLEMNPLVWFWPHAPPPGTQLTSELGTSGDREFHFGNLYCIGLAQQPSTFYQNCALQVNHTDT